MNVRPLDLYDDCNTLVMPARALSHATSAVTPIERSRDAWEGAGGQPIRSGVRAVRGDSPASIARSRADERTQPTLRYTSDLQRYRRLSLVLAICLALVLGVTASLAVQISAHFTPVAARAPRDGVTRGEWLSIFDGVETKAAPRARARRPNPRSPAPTSVSTSASVTASITASPSESITASPSESVSASHSESVSASHSESVSASHSESPSVPAAPSSAPPNDGTFDLVGRDLLREGLSAD